MTVFVGLPPWPKGPTPCWYCGLNLTRRKTWDHVVPKAKGGYNFPSNLVIACKRCNTDKAALTLEEYRMYLYSQKSVEALRRGKNGSPVVMPGPVMFAGEINRDCR